MKSTDPYRDSPTIDRTATNGIHWPRLYDLLIQLLTRGRDRAYRERALELAGIAPGEHVLDIGCGTGTQAIAAWSRSQPAGSVVGVDVSTSMLAVARSKARRACVEVTFREADAAALPFDDARFDVASLTTVLHMVPEERRDLCLGEAWRVLRPGGRLLLIDYAGDVGSRKSLVATHGAHGRFDLHTLRAALIEQGFEAVDGGPLDWLSLHFLRATKRESRLAVALTT